MTREEWEKMNRGASAGASMSETLTEPKRAPVSIRTPEVCSPNDLIATDAQLAEFLPQLGPILRVAVDTE
ncbi:MAG: hypothetical protein M3Y03_06305, partial [Verrucomicrobiota bacterium]|nr:hypothetical protein [Verrucomicrobiota bacterium]